MLALYRTYMPKQTNIFSDLFSEIFGSDAAPDLGLTSASDDQQPGLRSYACDTDKLGMTLRIDLPGIDPKTLGLKVGKSKVQVTGKNGDKAFTNTYTVSGGFDFSSAMARWQHGRLEVRIGRANEPAMQRIAIEIK